MIGSIDLDNIKKLTKVQTEYPQSVCGNKHIFTLIKYAMEVLKYHSFLLNKKFFGDVEFNDIGEKELLYFLNCPHMFLYVSPIKLARARVQRYFDNNLTQEDIQFIKSHHLFRNNLPFIREAILGRKVLDAIEKIIAINSPLSVKTQEQIVHLVILLGELSTQEKDRIKDRLLWIKEEEKRSGGIQKRRNSQPFKEKMYEEQKRWFYERKQKGLSTYATDFARKYYHTIKEQYNKDNSIRLPFHFSPDEKVKGEGLYGKPELHIEADNAFIFLTNLAQRNAREIKKEYSKNKT